MDADLAYYRECLAAAQARERADLGADYRATFDDGSARSPTRPTIGDIISAVLAVDDAADAARFFSGHATELRDAAEPRAMVDAEAMARANIGWCFGEGMSLERRAMWRAVCDAAHPYLGAMEHELPLDVVLRRGYELGQAQRARAGLPPLEADDALPEH